MHFVSHGHLVPYGLDRRRGREDVAKCRHSGLVGPTARWRRRPIRLGSPIRASELRPARTPRIAQDEVRPLPVLLLEVGAEPDRPVGVPLPTEHIAGLTAGVEPVAAERLRSGRLVG